MVAAMRFECKTNIEKAWLVSSLLAFAAHRLFEASAFGHYDAAAPLRLWLEVAMVALSFPLGGLVMFVLQGVALGCDGCRELEWTLDWSTLLFAGYIQWFWVLPEILRERQLTFLDLKQRPEHSSPPAAAAAPPLPAFDHAAFTTSPLAEFDEAGLTALDRVFQAPPPPPPAAARPSHVEAILPRRS